MLGPIKNINFSKIGSDVVWRDNDPSAAAERDAQLMTRCRRRVVTPHATLLTLR
jgi:hypothetical protein